jgi:glycosyltransferase involved in cell wall biosynthesis
MLINLLAYKIIVHSIIAKETLINDYSFDHKKLEVIPHGTNPLDKLEESTLSRSEARKLLVFGEIRRGKGIEYAIQAIHKLVTNNNIICELIIAGMYDARMSPESAGYLEELKKLVADLRLNNYVKFKLNIPEEDVGKLFSEADVVILPYVEDEIIAASGPLLTAMGFGKPIVATKLRRFAGYLLNGENSLIVEPANPDELAKAVILILRDDRLRRKLSESAHKYAREFSWEKIAKRTLSVYKELIKE